MAKGPSISSSAKQLQKLQTQQTQQALADRTRQQNMQAEDDSANARRAQMGALSTILTNPNKQTLG